MRLLFSPEAATPAGVTRDDPFYPLAGATNLPGPADARRPADLPRRPEAARDPARGPTRGGLAAHRAPTRATSRCFTAKRDELTRALEAEGRDPATFELVAQVHTGPEAADRDAGAGAGSGARGRRRHGARHRRPGGARARRRSRPPTATSSCRSAPSTGRRTTKPQDPLARRRRRRGRRRLPPDPATPASPTTPTRRDHLQWETATYPGEGDLLLAEAPDGTAIGAASSRSDLHVPARVRACVARHLGGFAGSSTGRGNRAARRGRRGGTGRRQDRVRDRAVRGVRGGRRSSPCTAFLRRAVERRSPGRCRAPGGGSPGGTRPEPGRSGAGGRRSRSSMTSPLPDCDVRPEPMAPPPKFKKSTRTARGILGPWALSTSTGSGSGTGC